MGPSMEIMGGGKSGVLEWVLRSVSGQQAVSYLGSQAPAWPLVNLKTSSKVVGQDMRPRVQSKVDGQA